MNNWIYVQFILEHTDRDWATGLKLVREVHEECFSSKKELKAFIKEQFKSSEMFDHIEKFKRKGKGDVTYVYRVVFD